MEATTLRQKCTWYTIWFKLWYYDDFRWFSIFQYKRELLNQLKKNYKMGKEAIIYHMEQNLEIGTHQIFLQLFKVEQIKSFENKATTFVQMMIYGGLQLVD